MVATIAVLSALAAFPATGTAAGGASDKPESRVQRELEIAPVHLDLAGKNRALVGQGSYLVNAVAACNDCHAGPSGEFAAGGDPFIIRAIYEYLSAIPCIEGDPGLPDPRPIGTRCQ